MPNASPFVGLLYDQRAAGPIDRLTAPPYDVISDEEQRRYHELSLFNVAHLILPESQPGDEGPVASAGRAGRALREWREGGILRPTPAPAVFPYELRYETEEGARRILGVVVAVDLEPWGGSIVPHERVLEGPLVDRLELLRATRANLSPIYAICRDAPAALSSFLTEVAEAPPAVEVLDEEGTRHRLWVSGEGAPIVGAALRERSVLIADGHHRYTVALAFRDEMRALRGHGPWDRMVMFVVDAALGAPPVLPYHRVLVPAAPVPTAPLAPARLPGLAAMQAALRDEELTCGIVRRADGRMVHEVVRLPGHPPTVAALHATLLEGVHTDRLVFVRDARQAERLVRAERASTAFVLPPTTVDAIWEVARRGERLPQKATLFWPKPRTGLVIRPLDPG